MKGKNYHAWNVDHRAFPDGGSIEDQIRFLLQYGVLAPSTHNTQPWLFKISGNVLTIALNHALKLAEADPDGRHMWISLGACTYNIEVAAAHFGLDAQAVPVPGKHHVAVTFKKAAGAGSAEHLFEAIPKRFSDKKVYQGQSIPADWLGTLPSFLPVGFHAVTDATAITVLADEYYTAAAACAYPAFGRELSGWLRGNRTKAADGMPGAVSGLSHPQAIIGKILSRYLPPAIKVLAKKYRQIVATSPMLGLITTPKDEPEQWWMAGRLYEHIALTAASKGYSTTPLAAMIEDKTARPQLAADFKAKGLPQMFFRVAIPDTHTIRTPRRQAHEVLL